MFFMVGDGTAEQLPPWPGLNAISSGDVARRDVPVASRAKPDDIAWRQLLEFASHLPGERSPKSGSGSRHSNEIAAGAHRVVSDRNRDRGALAQRELNVAALTEQHCGRIKLVAQRVADQ